MTYHLRQARVREAEELLAIVREAFADHRGVIDPPSSAERKTAQVMRAEMRTGVTFVVEFDAPLQAAATDQHASRELVACVLAHTDGDALHWQRLSVRHQHRGRGLASRLMDAVEQHALALGHNKTTLEVRVALQHQRAIYAARGYVEYGHGTHAGFSEPTYLLMEKNLTLGHSA
jgi:GNAT superfamily N-acetyltransferase